MKHLRFVLLFFFPLFLFSCRSSQFSSLGDKGTGREPIKLGVCQGGLTNSSEEYQLMDVLGADYIRNSIPWSSVEKSPGKWDFSYYDKFMKTAARYNKKVIIVLAYDTRWIYKKGDKSRNVTPDKLPSYLNYVKKIAERYGKQAYGFEIWNEPNTPVFWKGSDTDFLELTCQTAMLLKSILPDKPVAIGSLFYHPVMKGKSYLKKLIDSGILNYADAVSLHPYALSIKAAAKRVENADNMIKEAGYNKEIWVTEIGFTTGGWYPNKTSVPKQADAVVESIVRLTAAGADLITWFKLLDGQMPEDVKKGISSEEFFGLAYPDFSLKPSGKSYSLLAKNIQGSLFIKDGLHIDKRLKRKIEFFRFDNPDGTSSIIIRTKNGVKKVRISIEGEEKTNSVINLITGEYLTFNPESGITISRDPILILTEDPELQKCFSLIFSKK